MDLVKSSETLLSEKKRFLQSPKHGRYYWCRLHACKIFCKDFKIKNLRKYYDLYLQSDTLLLVDVFENFQNMCLEICERDPSRFSLQQY